MLVEKPMLNNTFQPAFNGGDMCRLSFFVSAIQSALHRIINEHSAYLAPNRNKMQKPVEALSTALLLGLYKGTIYKGAIVCREHISSSSSTSIRERFMKETANQHKAKQRQQSMSGTKLKAKGIFFDLDGTIVDSREAYVEAARTAFQTMELEPLEAEAALEIPRRLEQKQPINHIVKGDINKFLDVYLQAYYSISKEKTTLIPNISTTLQTLSKKAKLALITMRSVPKKTITKELQHFGIAKYFTHVVTALDTHKPKPSPEALIKCKKALEIQICDCIIVGDSVNDIKAGKAAGTKTVAVLSGLFSHEELAKEQPDLILKDATALPNFIE
jgi:HAD superfamily hydrolase (TIGR01509 family)